MWRVQFDKLTCRGPHIAAAHIHSIVTTSTGWETPFKVTERGTETGNREVAFCTVFTLARI